MISRITWPVVIIIIALLASVNIVLVFADTSVSYIAPLVNVIGIILVALFAKDGVEQNLEVRRDVRNTKNEIYDLKNDAEHQATLARIASLEARQHASASRASSLDSAQTAAQAFVAADKEREP